MKAATPEDHEAGVRNAQFHARQSPHDAENSRSYRKARDGSPSRVDDSTGKGREPS